MVYCLFLCGRPFVRGLKVARCHSNIYSFYASIFAITTFLMKLVTGCTGIYVDFICCKLILEKNKLIKY
jgi:hypothetical protein